MIERFVVDGCLEWMSWEEAYSSPRRVKTSLALTRRRARNAMRLAAARIAEAPLRDMYLAGYFFGSP